MVKNTQGKLSGDQFDHFKHFYMVVPALTLNYVQSLLVAKEKLLKKNFKGGYISDDGFIIGLTFLTEILEQKAHLREIHWFSEVKTQVAREIAELEKKTEELKNNKNQKSKKHMYEDDESIEMGLFLRSKKAFSDEFILLENGYKAAMVLFKDTTVK